MGKVNALAALLIVSALGIVQGDLIKSRLLKSKDAEKNAHQYHVALFRKLILMPEQFAGSGALISNTWVVTSVGVAKKVKPFCFLKAGQVKAGLASLNLTPIQALDVEEVITHEDFNSVWQSDNDIALVKVKSPGFTENEQIKFIPFAAEEPKGQVIVTSWHADGKGNGPLQELSLVLKDKASCGELLKKIDPAVVIDETVFCVENTARNGVSDDDLGSTAISKNGDQKYLMGIFTSVMEAVEGHEIEGILPAVFTNVTYHQSWIKSNMS